MRSRLSVFVLCLCAVLILAGAAAAAEIKDPILKKLVEKGILTPEEASTVMQEMEKETVGKEKEVEPKVEQKIEKKVSETMPEDMKDLGSIAKALKGIKFGLLWYLSYMNGEGADVGGSAGDGVEHSKFAIKRGYFRFTKEFMPWFEAHMTLDVTQASIPDSKLSDSIQVRIKYAYGKFKLPDMAFLTKPSIEVGVVHMPWLDYEENLNWYRCQDTMFVERNKTFNSADFGINFVSLFGGLMSEEYQNKVNNAYPGRYGSMALAVMNGGGYSASEQNQNKVLEGRLTLRPLPDIIPGLQLTYFGIVGKGNKETEPIWNANLGFASFEHEYVVLTGQYYRGRGNQGGDDEFKKDGYSFFTELKLYNMFKESLNRFSIIGRYDRFDPNTDAADDENSRYIAGVAYYLDKPHKNMVLLDYDTVDYKEPGKSDDKRIQLTLQVAL
jgi:polyhydroxyalkanoate synthesis regulator phasin